MQSDFDTLFFAYRPHADQIHHEERLLRDVGLIRTGAGDLALAEDPTQLFMPADAPTAKADWWDAARALLGRRWAS